MKLHMFAVYDSKAQAYLPPFFLPNTEVAKRVFQNASNDKGHAFGANVADYTLFHLGHFDDDSAKIVTKATPRNLGLAQQYVTKNLDQDEMDLDIPVQKLNSESEELTQ